MTERTSLWYDGGVEVEVSRSSAARNPDSGLYRGEDGIYANGTRYTLGEISRGSGVSRPHVTRVFSGKRNMSLEVAQRISSFLGVPLDELVEFMKRGRGPSLGPRRL